MYNFEIFTQVIYLCHFYTCYSTFDFSHAPHVCLILGFNSSIHTTVTWTYAVSLHTLLSPPAIVCLCLSLKLTTSVWEVWGIFAEENFSSPEPITACSSSAKSGTLSILPHYVNISSCSFQQWQLGYNFPKISEVILCFSLALHFYLCQSDLLFSTLDKACCRLAIIQTSGIWSFPL